LALMLLNGARLPTRVDTDGNLLRLKEQDRSGWDRAMIARGLYHLVQSTVGDEASAYHLQAGIAACHCAAKDYASTDWPQILWLYDRLIEMDASPVVALNRAVAVANVHGPRAGIEAVKAIQNREQLQAYYLLYAVLGEFEAQLDHRQVAIQHVRKALELATMKSEQMFLLKQLQDLEDPQPRRCVDQGMRVEE
jgi:RNA polymerase sigma-70 factor (ECF subfamily)